MGVGHVGLVHRDPCECKVKGFCAVFSIERKVPKRRHLQGVRHLMHGNVQDHSVASDDTLVLLLSGTVAYLPDLSAAYHLITPCWLGMVQMVRAVVEIGDVSQLRVIQCPHDVRVPHLELRPPGFATPSCLELLRDNDAMLAVNYHELASLDSIPQGWRLFQERIVLVDWRQAHLL